MLINNVIAIFALFPLFAFSFLKSNRANIIQPISAAIQNNKAGSGEERPKPVPKISASNLIQLVLMGAGAPGLGEFDRIDPETGKMFFKLEANNLVDKEGNSLQTKAKYFTDGYVEEADADKPPGFWGNLLTGGRLQSEWEERINAKKSPKR